MRRRGGRSEPERIGGEPIPGFTDVREIGGGGFSTVYQAVEEGTRRPVALKLLKVGGMQTALLDAFRAELQALALVSSHPNIVTLYRPLTTPDGRPVLVLELCRESYAQRLRAHGPLPLAEVLAVGVKIAGALETAHRAGFLHRDMKPQNVLVTAYGEPALADFGVAALQAAAQSTEGVFGFTTLHAPPEVLEGTPLSPATDVYGLASTLYQLLTGRAPFAAFEDEAPASVILRILRDPVRPLTSTGVPVALSDLLGAALSKDPAARPSGAAAFAEALRQVESGAGLPVTPSLVVGEPVTAARPPTTVPSRRPDAVPGADPLPPPAPPAPAPAPTLAPPAPAPAPAPTLAPPAPAPPAGPASPGLVAPVAGARQVLPPGPRPTPAAAPPHVSPPVTAAAPPPGSPPGPGAAPDLGRPVGHAGTDVRPAGRPAPDGPLEQTVIPSLDPAPAGARPAALRHLPADEGGGRARWAAVAVAATVVVAAIVALLVAGVL